MITDVDHSPGGTLPAPSGEGRQIEVLLGRRVMVLGDLLLPSEPSHSSRATCADIAQRLAEWQGPGTLVLCGQLLATECSGESGPMAALAAHPELTMAFSAFAARPESHVIVVVGTDVERDMLAGILA